MDSADIDNLVKLSDNPEAFEIQRMLLIRREIAALPADQRMKAMAFQMGLDRERDADPTGFAPSLWARIGENMENLGDQFVSLKHLIVGPPVAKHV